MLCFVLFLIFFTTNHLEDIFYFSIYNNEFITLIFNDRKTRSKLFDIFTNEFFNLVFKIIFYFSFLLIQN